ncbi:MAG: HU family DNA-binding protein [Fibrobacter sp.]|uniref:HU family DNA-binding protein n=1 Tax=Fibrobacter sp. TaxID=35828 RepID=UPI002A920247|nr:HU family DNA-binding protein [Fibrobacter sp.]MDY6264673.1 HU family DNA-binding protein [Fibrobacter sp.]
MANITKQALIQEIAKSTGFVRNDIKTVIEQFLDLLAEKLIEGNTIEIRGFGTFACKPRKARPARNPRTGETVLIEERMVPSFKFSNDIKDKINSLEAIVEGVNAKLESEGSDVMIAVQSQESPTDTESK